MVEGGGLYNLIGPAARLSNQPVGTVGTQEQRFLLVGYQGLTKAGKRFSKAEPYGGSPAPSLRGGSRLVPSISDRREGIRSAAFRGGSVRI